MRRIARRHIPVGSDMDNRGREERKEMDVSMVTEFINSVGFPIACVAAMFWMQNQEREQHRQEAEKFAEAINNNTQVMTRILERLGVKEDERYNG